MYYEIHGDGKPLVLIHGGGSTIDTTFGRVIPLLAKTRKVIALSYRLMEEQVTATQTQLLSRMLMM